MGIRTVRRGGLIALLSLMMVSTMAVGAGAQLAPGGTFSDDNGNVHEGDIEAIAAQGVARGCNPPANDLYCPLEPVTRGQMAALISRALDLAPSGDDHFVDDDDSVFADDIDALAAAGIARGCDPPDNQRFCPDDLVTRGAMAAFLVRGLGYTASDGDAFIDDDDSVFEGDIDRLAAAGVARGCDPPDNERFCPDEPVRRDQMASFLTRALGLEPITPPVPSTDDRRSDPFPGEGPGATLEEVRAAEHDGFDRVVFEFDGPLPGWSTALEDPPLLGDPSGQEIELDGDAYLGVVFNPAAAQWAAADYDGPDRLAVDGEIVTEVVEWSDFEGVNSWAVGLESEAGYALSWLEDPTRFVVDIVHG